MIRTNQTLLDCISAAPAEAGITLLDFRKGAVVLLQGEFPEWVYVVQEGLLKSAVLEANGKEYVVSFSGPGEILGEIEIFIQEPYLCSVTVLRPARLYRLSCQAFVDLLARNAIFCQAILAELAHRLYLSSRRASFQQLYPIEYSVLKLLALSQPDLSGTSRADIASYLGITLRSLNRTLRQLQEKGILTVLEKTIQITSPDGLHQELLRYERV